MDPSTGKQAREHTEGTETRQQRVRKPSSAFEARRRASLSKLPEASATAAAAGVTPKEGDRRADIEEKKPSPRVAYQRNVDSFPFKLHEMLEGAAKLGFDVCISWVQDGKAFRVHDREEFTKNVLPKYFSQTKFKSFQVRQCPTRAFVWLELHPWPLYV